MNNDVLKDRSGGNINGAALCGDDNHRALEGNASAQVNSSSNGQVVKLDDLGDAVDSLLEVRDLLEVIAKFDERSRAETVWVDLELTMLQRVQIRLDEHQVRAGLDWQETSPGNIDTVGVLEMTDSSSDSGLKLNNRDIRLSFLIGWNGLVVRDDFHLELVVLDNTLNSLDVQPDVVGVEVLELLDGLEFILAALWHLGDFEQTDRSLIVDDGSTLDIGLGLVSQLHDVLCLGFDHVLEDSEINNSAQVVDVGKEDNLNTSLDELVQNARVIQGFEDISVSGWVPIRDGRFEGFWCR